MNQNMIQPRKENSLMQDLIIRELFGIMDSIRTPLIIPNTLCIQYVIFGNDTLNKY